MPLHRLGSHHSGRWNAPTSRCTSAAVSDSSAAEVATWRAASVDDADVAASSSLEAAAVIADARTPSVT